MKSNQNRRSFARSSKRVKRGTTDSKLVNLDIVRAKRAEIFNRQLDSLISLNLPRAVIKTQEKIFWKFLKASMAGREDPVNFSRTCLFSLYIEINNLEILWEIGSNRLTILLTFKYYLRCFYLTQNYLKNVPKYSSRFSLLSSLY